MRFCLFLAALPLLSADADLILHNGKIVTADARFNVVEAIAIKVGKITRTGTSSAILAAEKGPRTNVVDLAGKTVLPGLIDAHVHAIGAGLSEFKSKLPPLDSIADIQNYIREKAKTTPAGEWIIVPRTLEVLLSLIGTSIRGSRPRSSIRSCRCRRSRRD